MNKLKQLSLIELFRKEIEGLIWKNFVGGGHNCICEGGGGIKEEMETERGAKGQFAFFETMIPDSTG